MIMPATMLARTLLVAASFASLSLAFIGCGLADSLSPSTCDRNFADPDPGPGEELDTDPEHQPQLYVDGTADGGVYRSEVAESGELLDWSGGTYYKLAHHLGVTPDWWIFYLSFSRYGIKQKGGVYAQATGNQAVLIDVDDEFLWVANDSCSNYYLRVVAGTGTAPP